ncbi:hypothetical protein JOM56_006758 [Amanita muscaria]
MRHVLQILPVLTRSCAREYRERDLATRHSPATSPANVINSPHLLRHLSATLIWLQGGTLHLRETRLLREYWKYTETGLGQKTESGSQSIVAYKLDFWRALDFETPELVVAVIPTCPSGILNSVVYVHVPNFFDSPSLLDVFRPLIRTSWLPVETSNGTWVIPNTYPSAPWPKLCCNIQRKARLVVLKQEDGESEFHV